MNASKQGFSFSMFRATAKRTWLHQWPNIILLLLINCLVFSMSSSENNLVFYFFVYFLFMLASCIRPLVVFHHSTHRLLMPHAKQYEFYVSCLILLLLCFTSSLAMFQQPLFIILGALGLLTAAFAYVLFTWRSETRLKAAMVILMLTAPAILLPLLIIEFNLRGLLNQLEAFSQTYIWWMIAALLATTIILFLSFYKITERYHEHDPSLHEETVYGNRKFKDYAAARGVNLEKDTFFNFTHIQQARLVNIFNLLLPKSVLRDRAFGNDSAILASSVEFIMAFSVVMLAMMFTIHISDSSVQATTSAFLFFGAWLVGFMTSSIDISSKKQLLGFLWLQTNASSREAFMQNILKIFLSRQIAMLAFLLLPSLLIYLLFDQTPFKDSLTMSLCLSGLATFFYFNAYTLCALSTSFHQKLGILDTIVCIILLMLIWIVASHSMLFFGMILGLGVFLCLLSIRRWKKQALEWV